MAVCSLVRPIVHLPPTLQIRCVQPPGAGPTIDKAVPDKAVSPLVGPADALPPTPGKYRQPLSFLRGYLQTWLLYLDAIRMCFLMLYRQVYPQLER